jgi:hypothetical protein
MFPGKALETEIRRAQIWHLTRKTPWKRLAHSLNNWLAKPTPEWEQSSQRPRQNQEFEFTTDENGNDF